MNCALWLNRKKVYSAAEIPLNLDVAALRGYFLAGTLVKWLRANGGKQYADALEKIPTDSNGLNEAIAGIFSHGSASPLAGGKVGSAFDTCAENGAAAYLPRFGTSFTGSYGSHRAWLSAGGSFSSSFGTGSFFTGSYASGSYKAFGGSFHEWEWEWLVKRRFGGSFGSGSYGSAAGILGSFPVGYKGFGSFDISAAAEYFGSGSGGSFRFISSDEYDMIMYATLSKCPLDRFGYGIHKI